MRVTRLYDSKSPVLSMEFFPPRNEKAEAGFGTIVDELFEMDPDYMSVTFGAGGSNRDGSYQAVKTMMDKSIPTVAYLAGYGMAPEEIIEVLDRYRDMGIKTIFVIRGDQPQQEGFAPHPDSFSYASDLIAFIKKRYDFTLGCAGYPEGHQEAESLEKDIEYLKAKVDNGAEYVVAQTFYDNRFYFDYVERCRFAGVTVPIIPGIMPVYSVKMARILAKVCGSTITPELEALMTEVDPDDKQAVLSMGMDFATDQCRGLLNGGAPGLHLYTMDRSSPTVEVVRRLRSENFFRETKVPTAR
ncbi:methylenetetrahydrofolate reductase [Desulfoluna sp.]|uniref:methylenetetrahydrofolate reductase n=1 Tax=Desulfoluna sp. TaxID=2045199 RepID=UPI0026356DE5|nr:methylenetetrahydrofolate reductase [Desulfoluna sp.]